MLIVHTIPCYIPNIEYKSNANAKTTTALLAKGTQEACKGKKCVWSRYKKVYNYRHWLVYNRDRYKILVI